MTEETGANVNADKALGAMAQMFNEAGSGELTDYQRGRFEQLAIGFLGSGGEPEVRQEWLEKADSRFGLTRGRVEVVRQMDNDPARLARSLIVLRLFPGKLKQMVGDLVRENPDRWQDIVTAVSLSLTNPKASEGFSQSDSQIFARAAERTLDFFTKEANEIVEARSKEGRPAGERMRRVEKGARREDEAVRRGSEVRVPARDVAGELLGRITDPALRLEKAKEMLQDPNSYGADKKLKPDFVSLLQGRGLKAIVDACFDANLDDNRRILATLVFVDRALAREQIKYGVGEVGIGGWLYGELCTTLGSLGENFRGEDYARIPEGRRDELVSKLEITEKRLTYIMINPEHGNTIRRAIQFLSGGMAGGV
jgi:hypothetical protein